MSDKRLNYHERCFLTLFDDVDSLTPRQIDRKTRMFQGRTKQIAMDLALSGHVVIKNKHGVTVDPKTLLLGSAWPYGGTIEVVG